MTEIYVPLPPATLAVPDTTKDCLSSKQFSKSLKAFQAELSEIIMKLDNKQPNDQFAVTLEIDFHCKAVKGTLGTGGNDNKFTFFCYCNGGD
jgi:hypothetical protein